MVSILEHLHEEPIAVFAILLAVILIVPILVERINLPGLIGLLAAGIILGPHALNLLNPEDPIMPLLSDIGLLYLMFVAGLEIDLDEFQKMKYRAAGFGSLTFFLPLIIGTGVGLIAGFSWVSALLLGSLIASHSLLAYPIVSDYGVTRNPAVVTTLGATIFTDIAALIVLAVCISASTGNLTLAQLTTLILGLAAYSTAVLIGFNRLGHFFFRKFGDNQGNQFLIIFLAIFVAAIGAEVIGIEKIVGAFLAGLAVNEVVGNSRVKEKVVFIGKVLFIPIFFIDIGLLVDLPAFFSNVRVLKLSLSIVTALLIGKYLAAEIARRLYGFRKQEMLTMWGMSLPQVATTLAAALVGNQAGLLDDEVLNAVVIMMLVTALIGPLIVKHTAQSLLSLAVEEQNPKDIDPSQDGFQRQPFIAIVPVHNPKTERYLIEMASVVAGDRNGIIKPLAIACAYSEMDSPYMARIFQQQESLLTKATEISSALDVSSEPILRIDDDVAKGISRVAKEHQASLILMGWSARTSIKARLFGNVIDNVLWSAHCPVAITRLRMSPCNIKTILVPIKQFTSVEVRKIQLATALAKRNNASITLLHVTLGNPKPERMQTLRSCMKTLVGKSAQGINILSKVITNHPPVKAILTESTSHDLVIMYTRRRRSSTGNLRISRLSNQVVNRLLCSLILLGEPHHHSETRSSRQLLSLLHDRSIHEPVKL